ncbi:MAG: hypothetical protein ABIX28_23150 [Vicinamibacterales bacterium]
MVPAIVTSRPFERLFMLAVAGLLVAACVGTVIAPLNTDTAWFLVAARRVLGGERLYVDLMETNPPLIVWLWMGPAWLGAFTRLSDQRVAGVVVAATIAGCSLLALSMLGRDTSRVWRIWLLASWLAALVGLCLWDVGQREQFAAMLTLPYACLAARRMTGERASHDGGRPSILLTGVLAGVGFALKPFFLGALVSIELVVFAVTGWRRTLTRVELWAVLAIHAIYAALIVVVTPEYLRDITPAVLATYGAYGNGVEWVLRSKRAWLPALLAVVALGSSWLAVRGAGPASDRNTGPANATATAVRRSGHPSGSRGLLGAMTMAAALTRVMSTATLGWLIGFVAQGKGWRYHLIQVMVFGTAALAAAAAQLWSLGPVLWRRSARTRVLVLVAGALLLLAAVPAGLAARRVVQAEWRAWWAAESSTERLAAVVSQLAPGDPIYVLSTSMAPAFPVVNLAGAQWPYRYHFLWPLPGLYAGPTGTPIPYRAPAEQGPLEREFFERVLGDLERVPPRLLIVDRQRDQQGMAYGRPFDFLRYFSASPRFVEVFSHYRRAGAVGAFDIYERVR